MRTKKNSKMLCYMLAIEEIHCYCYDYVDNECCVVAIENE